ncbi:hypothetical protein QFZ75_002098 [Streptomyces sp. V3I8]|nr:hypothetical protein [Streptomyces sp. V3I8]
MQARFAEALREQAGDWHEAMLLRAYCDALERRLVSVEEADSVDTEEASRWLDWARRYVQALDPLSRLPVVPSRREPTPDDLKPYLKGWTLTALSHVASDGILTESTVDTRLVSWAYGDDTSTPRRP